jgi:predicted nucleic acid binding AN1-type Zn finger protein
MKKVILAVAVLCLSVSLTHAEDSNKKSKRAQMFEKVKTFELSNLETLQECVEKASLIKEIKACKKSAREKEKQFREELKELRKKYKEERAKMKEERQKRKEQE